MSEEQTPTRGWMLPVVLGVLVLGLVAIALTRGPVELDPDTAEGTVQEYLVALNDADYERALELLHPQWGEGCEPDDLRNAGRTDFTARLGHVSSSGVIEEFGAISTDEFPPDRELPGATDFVEVTIHQGETGFGAGWDEYVVFELVEDDGFYWIVGDPWPYFTWNCRNGF